MATTADAALASRAYRSPQVRRIRTVRIAYQRRTTEGTGRPQAEHITHERLPKTGHVNDFSACVVTQGDGQDGICGSTVRHGAVLKDDVHAAP